MAYDLNRVQLELREVCRTGKSHGHDKAFKAICAEIGTDMTELVQK